MKNNILTKNENENLGVILLNHIANFTTDAPNDILQYHVDIYNKLTIVQIPVRQVLAINQGTTNFFRKPSRVLLTAPRLSLINDYRIHEEPPFPSEY